MGSGYNVTMEDGHHVADTPHSTSIRQKHKRLTNLHPQIKELVYTKEESDEHIG
uniref:Uncharacterized protein n=1 Tax=Arundo donax TaxID=35708 RepID=A0A0A9F2F6_ARUDO